jgi:very-short-patch-repair endonuclease
MSLIDELISVNVFTSSGQINKQANRLLTQKFPELLDKVITSTNFLTVEGVDTRVRLFCIQNGILTQPVCEHCGDPTSFNRAKRKFNTFCPNTKSPCAMSSQRIREQIDKTNLTRYGTTNPTEHVDIRERIRSTCVERYGGNAPASDSMIVDKIAETKRKKQENDPTYTARTVSKRKTTMLERYDRETSGALTMNDSAHALIHDKQALIDALKDFSKTEIAELYGLGFTTLHNACKKYGIDYTPKASPRSTAETELVNYIKSITNSEIILNSKSIIPPYELDIVIPELNVAIEYNGIFWHSELSGRPKYYHINKTQRCNEIGLQLIHIWSREWEQNPRLVKSRIAHALNVDTNQRVFARKCQIDEIPRDVARDFCERNHTQGHVNAAVYYGLFHNDVLYAVMTFGTARYTTKYDYELLRYCSEVGTNVVGGASKLFKHFVKMYTPNAIVSYCDLRWGSGTMYERIGFERVSTSRPNYHYFIRNGTTNNLFSRIAFQKHKLKDKLETFDSNLTEWENMKANGFDRIWDCGNAVFKWQSIAT